jgi:hypothetical protein
MKNEAVNDLKEFLKVNKKLIDKARKELERDEQ